jgi:hypothetical protein
VRPMEKIKNYTASSSQNSLGSRAPGSSGFTALQAVRPASGADSCAPCPACKFWRPTKHAGHSHTHLYMQCSYKNHQSFAKLAEGFFGKHFERVQDRLCQEVGLCSLLFQLRYCHCLMSGLLEQHPPLWKKETLSQSRSWLKKMAAG